MRDINGFSRGAGSKGIEEASVDVTKPACLERRTTDLLARVERHGKQTEF